MKKEKYSGIYQIDDLRKRPQSDNFRIANFKIQQDINSFYSFYNNYYIVFNSDMLYRGVISKGKYGNCDPDEFILLRNSYLYDKHNEIMFQLSNDGNILSQIEPIPSIISNFEFVGDIVPSNDILGDLINNPTINVEEEIEENTHIPSNKIKINATLIGLINEDLKKFWKYVDSDTLPEDETLEEKMVRIAVTEPGQFDEVFTVEVDRPESPLMRKFLFKLAELVNSKLSELEGDGVDDLTPLQKEAYKFAGYQGKSFETVLEEQKDYSFYFRYLLMKGERISISEHLYEFFKSLSNIYTFKDGDKPIELIHLKDKYFAIKSIAPRMRINKNEIMLTYFSMVDDIHDTSDIEKSNLALKIGLHNETVREKYVDKISKGLTVHTRIFICDKNLNYGTFKVKQSTLDRWTKKSVMELKNVEKCYMTGRDNRIWGISDFSI